MKAFPTLFSPIAVGKMQLKNRVVMPAMGTNFARSSGEVTDTLINYYVERAKGGTGLITTEVTSVAEGGGNVHAQLSVSDDRYIPGLRRLARAVQACGARIALQLHHAGRRAGGPAPVAPSPIAYVGWPTPRALTMAEIEGLVLALGAAARRAREAGFDAVELHGTHGYLIAQFLSPLTNRRTDRYGGALANRMRFGLEAMTAIKRAAGDDFPVICRITGDEGLPGGSTIEDAKVFAQELVKAGADALHVSAGGGVASTPQDLLILSRRNVPVMGDPPGVFVPLAEAIRRVVSVPVIAVGRINTPALAEEILAEGKADLVAVGRGVIADAQWAQKAAEGRPEDITICLACSECNHALITKGGAVDCAVNPTVGREASYRITPAKHRRRVVVVGGGPAGMEAARVAALRGHVVTLYEKSAELGGMLRAAAISLGKEALGDYADGLSLQARKAGAEIILRHEFTKVDMITINPEALVLATGAKPTLPAIPGIDEEIVSSGVDVLLGKIPLGEEPIVVGGGMVGCETAAFLAERGKKVKLVTRRGEEGLAIDMTTRARQWFFSTVWGGLGVKVITFSQFTEVVNGGLVVTDQQGIRKLIEGDMVVFCVGMTPVDGLKKHLALGASESYIIGDCAEPRRIMQAVREGFEAGLKL
ncbi:MAG: FAD-dependent oxidoreductase [Chloroflexi bacterium]|nr:FAD-dependent oxidoreductase [Chloroflexota bacterium]